jgi:hypothetical protein
MDFDLRSDVAFEKLEGADSLSPEIFCLLRDRMIEPTLLSDSNLLFSRLRPNPNLFRKDEVFELTEPAVVDLELIDPSTFPPIALELIGRESSKSLSKSSIKRSRSEMYSNGGPSSARNSAKAAVSAPRSPSFPEASSSWARSLIMEVRALLF